MSEEELPIEIEIESEDEKESPEVANSPGEVSTPPRDFYLKEYEALRKEADWMLQDSRAVERNVVIAIGVFWAFLLKLDHQNQIPFFGWWIPLVFASLGAARSYAIGKKFDEIGNYIRKLEAFLGGSQAKEEVPLGWQCFQDGPPKRKNYITWSGEIFWTILLLVTLVVAAWQTVPWKTFVHWIQGL